MATSTVDLKARRTTVALKIAMAVTGLFFVLFLLMHMYGNMKLFLGADAFNGYAHWIRELLYPLLPHEGLLWILRVVLLASVIIHAYAAITLWKRANKARGRAYKVNSGRKVTTVHSYTNSLMRWGGIGLGLFIVFHILQFTTLHLSIGADYSAITPYDRVVAAFQPEVWWVYAIYFLAMASLAFHVHHGVWSALVSLGLSRSNREKAFKVIADLSAFALFVGFMVPPTAILVGFIS